MAVTRKWGAQKGFMGRKGTKGTKKYGFCFWRKAGARPYLVCPGYKKNVSTRAPAAYQRPKRGRVGAPTFKSLHDSQRKRIATMRIKKAMGMRRRALLGKAAKSKGPAKATKPTEPKRTGGNMVYKNFKNKTNLLGALRVAKYAAPGKVAEMMKRTGRPMKHFSKRINPKVFKMYKK